MSNGLFQNLPGSHEMAGIQALPTEPWLLPISDRARRGGRQDRGRVAGRAVRRAARPFWLAANGLCIALGLALTLQCAAGWGPTPPRARRDGRAGDPADHRSADGFAAALSRPRNGRDFQGIPGRSAPVRAGLFRPPCRRHRPAFRGFARETTQSGGASRRAGAATGSPCCARGDGSVSEPGGRRARSGPGPEARPHASCGSRRDTVPPACWAVRRVAAMALRGAPADPRAGSPRPTSPAWRRRRR